MRTTLTLESDVAIRLEKLRKERGESLKSVVNEVLRRGLDTLDQRFAERERYAIEPHDRRSGCGSVRRHPQSTERARKIFGPAIECVIRP